MNIYGYDKNNKCMLVSTSDEDWWIAEFLSQGADAVGMMKKELASQGLVEKAARLHRLLASIDGGKQTNSPKEKAPTPAKA